MLSYMLRQYEQLKEAKVSFEGGAWVREIILSGYEFLVNMLGQISNTYIFMAFALEMNIVVPEVN